jgi:hypothetical protein
MRLLPSTSGGWGAVLHEVVRAVVAAKIGISKIVRKAFIRFISFASLGFDLF